MSVGVKLTGVNKIMSSLKNKAEVDRKIQSAVKANGAELQTNAQRFAPVDTGTLRRSIMLTLKDGGMTAEVEAWAEYARYQEYGTRRMQANPYMRPALNIQKDIFLSDVKKALGE